MYPFFLKEKKYNYPSKEGNYNNAIEQNQIVLISGPCVIESQEITFKIASKLKEITSELNIPFIFKASFDKANRSSIKSFRGPGFETGLQILRNIKNSLNLPIISDIHSPEQALKASEVLDVIQIPAFLCRQTDLICEAAKTGKPLNIKKGQFLSPFECSNIIEKAKECGCKDISITERGTTFGYNNLVVDFRSIQIIKEMGVSVIFDATHSVQFPGGGGVASSGESRFAPYLARAAVAVGADGVFIETHPDPKKALCDGSNSIPLENMAPLLSTLVKIKEAICGVLDA